jgi:hypothetical protein
MAKKAYRQLPESLRYLQPFVRWMAKLPPDAWNENLDPSRLEAALRKRLRGLDEADAEDALSKDRELLEGWLKTFDSTEHPAWWLVGYLMSPDLTEYLFRPPEPPRRGPEIAFEPPDGWKTKAVPFQLQFKMKNLVGDITAAEEGLGADILKYQIDHEPPPWTPIDPPGVTSGIEAQAVKFGDVIGRKTIHKETGRVSRKQIEYKLAVPGGFVMAVLTTDDADFDESPFEARLHTLRLSWPI